MPRLEAGGSYEIKIYAKIDGDIIPIYKIRIHRKITGPPLPASLRYETSSFSEITLMWEELPVTIDGYRLTIGIGIDYILVLHCPLSCA